MKKSDAQKLGEALTFWYSDECSNLPTIVHACNYVKQRWGERIFDLMVESFIDKLKNDEPLPECPRQWPTPYTSRTS